MEDPYFNDPLFPSTTADSTTSTTTTTGEGYSYKEEDVATLTSFGYSAEQAQAALKATDHSMEK